MTRCSRQTQVHLVALDDDVHLRPRQPRRLDPLEARSPRSRCVSWAAASSTTALSFGTPALPACRSSSSAREAPRFGAASTMRARTGLGRRGARSSSVLAGVVVGMPCSSVTSSARQLRVVERDRSAAAPLPSATSRGCAARRRSASARAWPPTSGSARPPPQPARTAAIHRASRATAPRARPRRRPGAPRAAAASQPPLDLPRCRSRAARSWVRETTPCCRSASAAITASACSVCCGPPIWWSEARVAVMRREFRGRCVTCGARALRLGVVVRAGHCRSGRGPCRASRRPRPSRARPRGSCASRPRLPSRSRSPCRSRCRG